MDFDITDKKMKLKMSDSAQISALINRVRMGDQNAFALLLESYNPLIESLITRFSNGDGAEMPREDLRQEATVGFYHAILAYDLDQSEVEFGLYAKICISNALISQFRRQKRRTPELLTESLNTAFLVHASDDPSMEILEEERVKTLYSVIRKNLSDLEYRIWQFYMSGYTARDIGKAVGKDEKSVSNAIYRIRKKLRALLG